MSPHASDQVKEHLELSRVARIPLGASWLGKMLIFLGRPAPEFPNRLEAGISVQPPRRALGVLFALFLLSLIPRVWMAARLPAVCPDAVLYLTRAQALERGDWNTGLNHLRVNTLPLALVGLHQLGLEWEFAGKAWNVALSSLAVLPLFGWARRQFDDRIALMSCVLYAVHPSLIERSPEILREPGFWFFALLSLYLSWRAATEARLALFGAAGAAIILALLTRFEGIFLVIPLVWWTTCRVLAGSCPRRRLLIGLFVALFTFPILLALLGQLIFPTASVTSWIRFDPLARAGLWLESWTGADSAAAHEASSAVEVENGHASAFLHLLQTYLVTTGRGFDPIVALLLPASVIGWFSLWFRRDQVPILLAAGAILFGAWIHLWYAHEISSRYVLSVFLLLCPLCALGICWPAEKRQRLLPSVLAGSAGAQGALALLVLAGLGILGWSDALGSSFDSRAAQAELGRRIAREFPDARFAGSPRISALVAYYAGAQFEEISPTEPADQFVARLDRLRPEAILIDRRDARLRDLVLSRSAAWGMTVVDPKFFPPRYADDALLLLRTKGMVAEAHEFRLRGARK
jgi:hypothetical protein